MEKVILDIEKFVLFHKGRISLLKGFEKNKIHGRLIFQISFLGVESLASVLYLEERDSKKRFIELLSKAIRKDEATQLYESWRCALTHEGFIKNPWTTLEGWDEDDVSFLSYSENKLRSGTEYPPGSIIAMYENLINYFDDFFKRTDTKKIKL